MGLAKNAFAPASKLSCLASGVALAENMMMGKSAA
jgi:hypothetical protein